MFRNIRVHPRTSRWREGIERLVDTIFTLEKLTTEVELDIFVLSILDMTQAHYLSKGHYRPTDALTFHEDRHTRETVHSILFHDDNDRVFEKGLPSESRSFSASVSFGCGGVTNLVENAELIGLKGETHAKGTHQFTALMEAKRYETSKAGLRHLGEIYLCPDYMQYRLRQFPLQSLPSFSLYMQAALVHAVLHALGEDHKLPHELRQMVKKEQKLGLHLNMLARRCIFFSPYFLFSPDKK